MDTAKSDHSGGLDGTQRLSHEAEAEKAVAWELVDAGRYRPRRIRGSCRGRELG